MFGRPPKAVFWGHQADMVSSIEIHRDEDKSSRRIELQSSTAEENYHHGSLSFLDASLKIDGKKRRNSFHL
jgi:hypothetical protein